MRWVYISKLSPPNDLSVLIIVEDVIRERNDVMLVEKAGRNQFVPRNYFSAHSMLFDLRISLMNFQFAF